MSTAPDSFAPGTPRDITTIVEIVPAGPGRPGRLASVDAYRGLVMFLLIAEAFHFAGVAKQVPGSRIWGLLAHHQEHVDWIGCTLHDLIQPSFSFLVGTAMALSLANRASKGQSIALMTAHALWRALVLVFLGIFLRSIGHTQTRYTFEDTLTQIGLGYPFLFLLGLRPQRDRWIALGAILIGYWALFAFYPLPGADFDYPAVGVPADWPHLMTGFPAHWNKNSNPAWAFDVWFLNLFPREGGEPFRFNGGGYATLSFIPTLATMLLGLIAGDWLRRERPPARTLAWLVGAGLVGLGAGWALNATGVCPLVKRIWTPSWVLFSGGWCFLFLAAFHAVVDLGGLRWLTAPLIVVGMNSIAAYLMTWLFEKFIATNLRVHLSDSLFRAFGPQYDPAVHGALVVLTMWLLLYWMYRRRIFLRI